MSSDKNQATKKSRFKSFIRGVSTQPSQIPQQNYKNLKYIKDTVSKSTSNTSISSITSNNSSSITQKIQDETSTKLRFASLKSITIDSFSINSSNDFKRNSKDSGLLIDQLNTNSKTSFNKQQAHEVNSNNNLNLEKIPVMRNSHTLPTRPKSAIEYKSFMDNVTISNKRNSCYETSKSLNFFSI